MKTRRTLSRSVSFAVLTLSALICGCSSPGDALFKTDTERSILKWSTGNYEDAVHYAQRALRDEPDDAYAMMVAGLSYERLGYPNRARAFYEQAAHTQGDAVGVFGSIRNTPAEEVKKAAAERLEALTLTKNPIAVVDAETQTAVFASAAYAEARAANQKPAPETVKGGLDMLTEGDRNLVMRFLTFIRLRDEKYATEDEWQKRRAVNLGGLLPYTLTPAGKGMDLPAPSGDAIIGRLNALREALEMRAITPREHAAEREIILEALLPADPFYRMKPEPVPQDLLQGATALRRLETLRNLGLITAAEAKKEKAAVEKLTYAKIGMTGADGQSAPEVSKCVQKCVSAPASPCPAVKKTAPAKKKAAVKKKAAPKKTTPACPCL